MGPEACGYGCMPSNWPGPNATRMMVELRLKVGSRLGADPRPLQIPAPENRTLENVQGTTCAATTEHRAASAGRPQHRQSAAPVLPSDEGSKARVPSGNRYLKVMEISPDEEPVVRRAVAAYHEAKVGQKGPFRGRTADEILEELRPSPVRWTHLAAFVIEAVEGRTRWNR